MHVISNFYIIAGPDPYLWVDAYFSQLYFLPALEHVRMHEQLIAVSSVISINIVLLFMLVLDMNIRIDNLDARTNTL